MTGRSGIASGNRMILAAVALLILSGNVHGEGSWDAIYLAGSKIGWVHTYVEKVKSRGKEYQRVRVDIEQSLKRGQDIAVTKLSYGTIETLDGQVLKLDTLTLAGTQKLRAHGDVIKGAMTLILDSGGQPQKLVIPWTSDVRGPYAAEQSMAKKPMKENEARRLKMFMPTLNKICDIELRSLRVEPVIMGDGSKHRSCTSSRPPRSTTNRNLSSISRCGSMPTAKSSNKNRTSWAGTSSTARRRKQRSHQPDRSSST